MYAKRLIRLTCFSVFTQPQDSAESLRGRIMVRKTGQLIEQKEG